MDTETKCNCQHCNGNIFYPTEMAGQTIQCPHCQTETLLPAAAAPKQKGITKVLISAIIGAVLFVCIGYALFVVLATKQMQSSEQTIDNSERGVKGALGWNLGDVLPNTYQVKTNDDIYGITCDFDPPADLGLEHDVLASCFLVLTDDRRIAAIEVSGKENDRFNLVNFQNVFKDKYGLGRVPVLKDDTITTYFYGQGSRQIMLRSMRGNDLSTIDLSYQDSQLWELAEKQKQDRKTSVNNHIQNNLKGKF